MAEMGHQAFLALQAQREKMERMDYMDRLERTVEMEEMEEMGFMAKMARRGRLVRLVRLRNAAVMGTNHYGHLHLHLHPDGPYRLITVTETGLKLREYADHGYALLAS